MKCYLTVAVPMIDLEERLFYGWPWSHQLMKCYSVDATESDIWAIKGELVIDEHL